MNLSDVALLEVAKGYTLHACRVIDQLPDPERAKAMRAMGCLEAAEKELADMIEEADAR